MIDSNTRLKSLKQLMNEGSLVKIMEVHSPMSGVLVEKTTSSNSQFDGMWFSSLTNSYIKGKPDIEYIDSGSRLQSIDEIFDVTTKPMIYDGDTGGQISHLTLTVNSLIRKGVSAIIIEDKTGLKHNSFSDKKQEQETIELFCEKIKSVQSTKKSDDFMFIARIESFVVGNGLDDALARARSYISAGVDGIMIHSKKRDGNEIREFCQIFRKEFPDLPLVLIPTTYNEMTEQEMISLGVNVVIYANHMLRSAYKAMENTLQTILDNQRAKECENNCKNLNSFIGLIDYEG